MPEYKKKVNKNKMITFYFCLLLLLHLFLLSFWPANGSLVIGQEQDRLGGGFSESEAFLGKLSLLDMWDTVLDENNITTLWDSCEQYHGNLVAWAHIRQYIHGDVLVIIPCRAAKFFFKSDFNAKL